MELLLEKIGKFSPLQVGVLTVCGAFAGYALVKTVLSSRKSVIYPPGPPQDPLIGNLRNFPADRWYETFSEWQKTYGDLIYIRLPGVSMLIVNKVETAHLLLSKRMNVNSSRTVGYMINELMDFKWNVALRQADKTHQDIRTMLRKGIGPQRVGVHDHVLDDCVKELMLHFRTLRGDPSSLLKSAVGRMVIQIAYGERVWKAHGKELTELNDLCVEAFTAGLSNFWLVNIFEFLRFIPSWMPGAEFQRIGEVTRGYSHRIKTLPWERLLDLYRSGMSEQSLGTDLLDEYGPSDNVKYAIGVLYFAGVDSTSTIISIFLYTMFLLPKVAQKVHDEIVKTIGKDRLPTIADRASLPYTEAVWKESMRWTPGLPLVIPHTSTEDQFCDGYFIPKGTVINPNYGFMLSDPSIWGDPEVFRPERFLIEHNPHANELPNPSQLIFGFGARICSGMHLADRLGFYIAAMSMSLYEILPLEGKTTPNPDGPRCRGDLIRHPIDFECRFVPRGQNAVNLLSSISLEIKA